MNFIANVQILLGDDLSHLTPANDLIGSDAKIFLARARELLILARDSQQIINNQISQQNVNNQQTKKVMTPPPIQVPRSVIQNNPEVHKNAILRTPQPCQLQQRLQATTMPQPPPLAQRPIQSSTVTSESENNVSKVIQSPSYLRDRMTGPKRSRIEETQDIPSKSDVVPDIVRFFPN